MTPEPNIALCLLRRALSHFIISRNIGPGQSYHLFLGFIMSGTYQLRVLQAQIRHASASTLLTCPKKYKSK